MTTSASGTDQAPWWYAAVAALLGALAAGAFSLLIQRRQDKSALDLARTEREAGESERKRLAELASDLETELARLQGASSAYRAQLPADDLGSASALVADLLGTGALLLRTQNEAAWRERIQHAKVLQREMRSLRHRLFYLEPGLDGPLVQLGNMPQWAASYIRVNEGYRNHDPEASAEFLRLANELRDQVYEAFRMIAIEGRALTGDEKAALSARTDELVAHWQATSRDKPGPIPE